MRAFVKAAAIAAAALFSTQLVAEDRALVQQYNLWLCKARPQGFYPNAQEYVGASNVFAAGSGEGQNARVGAYQSALRSCQRYTYRQCFARIEECQVFRFTY